jgi:FKBP-type peptidyl-prolyl cis-trans isomerase
MIRLPAITASFFFHQKAISYVHHPTITCLCSVDAQPRVTRMGRARRDRRDQERKARRKRKLNNKEGDANVDANSFPIQQRQRRTTPSPKGAEAATTGDGGSMISVEAVAGESIAATGRNIPGNEEEKQTTTSIPSIATNPASKMSKQEQQRFKIQQRKEQRKAKKAASALGAQQVEEGQKRVAQALAQMQSRQKQEEQLLLQNKFVTCSKGVQYCDIRIGKGSLLKQKEEVSVQYVLRAKKKGGKILQSNDQFEFQLGTGNVIEGWDIGMEGMRRGGARHLIVPKDAGYADKDIGGGDGADLYFEIEAHLC